MKKTNRTPGSRSTPRLEQAGVRVVAGALSVASAACSSDEATIVEPTNTLEQPTNAAEPTRSTEPAAASPAVLLGVIIENPETRNIYVAALPDVPSGEVDYSQFREFGNVDLSTYGGDVFVWDRDPAVMTKFAVNDDLSLVEGPAVSFANYGGAGGQNVFVSASRAYLLPPNLDAIVVWDPSSMVITGTIPVAPPERPANFIETFAHSGRVVGDSVIWQIASNDFDTPAVYPAATLAIASATRDDPWQLVEDTRCAGTDGGYVDARGDYYVRAGAYWGYFAAYGTAAPTVKTCVLRVLAGQRTFDPDYSADMLALTGSYINFPWFHVQGSSYLAQAWDTTLPIPENPDEFWTADLVPQLVDLQSMSATPYPDIDGSIMVQSAEFEVDGVSYYEVNPEGYSIGGEPSRIVELRPEGVVERFTVPGLWALARIR